MKVQKLKSKNIFLKLLLIALFCALGLVGAATTSFIEVAAQSITTDQLDVEITVNKDSTFDVRETATLTFNGQSRGVLRGITLEDPQRDRECASNAGLTCGNFEYITITGVYDESGALVDPQDYELSIQTDEDSGKRHLVVRWEVWPGGKFLQNEQFTWTLEYRVLGGLIYDDDATYLYWNALYAERDGQLDKASITINFPSGTPINESNLEIYTLNSQEFRTSTAGSTIKLQTQDLPRAAGAVTVAYPINKSAVDMFGTLHFTQLFPFGGPTIKFQDTELVGVGSPLLGLPTGEYEIEFSRPGFLPETYAARVTPDGQIYYTYSLTPTTPIMIAIGLIVLLNMLGLIITPLAVYLIYSHWATNGRDENMPKTIIPIYQPPKGIRPYLLGSVKDERVDREDVTSSIIDLAYRGFIKIKELDSRKNYRLTLLDKDQAELDDVEAQLIADLFGDASEVETKDLKNTFYAKYQLLTKKIARKMVSDGYFKRLPESVRGQYFGIGIFLFGIGVFAAIFLSFPFIEFISFFGPFMLGVAAVVAGVAYMIAANYMPAKTSKGSKLFAEILGFKMYLDFAERYRLQNLSPEEFEKYLSYAVAFQIEKEWAQKFEGIYNGQPDWYESDHIDVWDVYVLSQFTRNFSTNMNSVVYTQVQSNSASGGGWSSGGFSGGFSGGGGGGGFGGGF